MADLWEPDEEFLEFLELFQEAAGVELTIGGNPIVEEMRVGTSLGRDLYEKMYVDPDIRAEFERWKANK